MNLTTEQLTSIIQECYLEIIEEKRKKRKARKKASSRRKAKKKKRRVKRKAKRDACYYKVKSRYKVWPSAYASGALVKCRKVGAKNWGEGGKKK
jgi:topoisomerase IA-like protein|tara:strand:+ start:1100 stop:1381 length:282 start_codon:yes stop_codon:yes gene_type:complete